MGDWTKADDDIVRGLCRKEIEERREERLQEIEKMISILLERNPIPAPDPDDTSYGYESWRMATEEFRAVQDFLKRIKDDQAPPQGEPSGGDQEA